MDVEHILFAHDDDLALAIQKRLEANPEYKQAVAMYSKQFNVLLGLLGDKAGQLTRLDELNNEIGSFNDLENYRQGYRDCLAILAWMGAFDRSI